MSSKIIQILAPKLPDPRGLSARKLLPHENLPMVGPFIFFDHHGPKTLPPGQGADICPHPHINLATITYLFEGAIMHRDSIGSNQEIRSGDVNWMTAGRGIVHSERSPQTERDTPSTLHVIQAWVALPDEHEETEPTFEHYPAASIPQWQDNGVTIALIVGSAYGRTSPVKILSPILYLDLFLSAGSSIDLPADYSERAIYSLTSDVQLDGSDLEQYRLAILAAGESVTISAQADARCVVFGGEPVGRRQQWWNFVSSRPERIEQAKHDWQSGNFDTVPGEAEWMPLPVEVVNANDSVQTSPL